MVSEKPPKGSVLVSIMRLEKVSANGVSLTRFVGLGFRCQGTEVLSPDT